MKRIDLIKHLKKHGCLLVREGGNHTIYTNPINGNLTAIPPHKEIKKFLVKKICQDLEIPAPF